MNDFQRATRPRSRYDWLHVLGHLGLFLGLTGTVYLVTHGEGPREHHVVTTRDHLLEEVNLSQAMGAGSTDSLEALGLDSDQSCLRPLAHCQKLLAHALPAQRWVAEATPAGSCFQTLQHAPERFGEVFVGYERRLLPPPTTEGNTQATEIFIVTTPQAEDLPRCPNP